MVLIDHGGRDAKEADIVAPPTDLAGVVEHLWVAHLTAPLASAWRVVLDTSAHVSPKRMLRVRRLHAALRAARTQGRSWCEIAYATGYADQAHLTREVRALLGEPPTAWAARGSAVSFKTPTAGRR